MLLNCHTYYSFCYGTFAIETLLQQVQQNGYDTFVLSDINNTSACLDVIRLAPNYGLKPIVGIDFRNNAQQQYIGIANNNEGFKELNEHLSLHLHSNTHFNEIAPEFNHAFVVYPLSNYKGWPLRNNEFVGISIKELSNLNFLAIKQKTNKLVALQTVSFANKQAFNAHRLLRAIDTNNLLSKLPITQQAKGTEMMLSKVEMYAAYAAYPHIITNTEHILNSCQIHFDYGKLTNKNLAHYTDSIATDISLLRSLCMEGLSYRYSNPSVQVLQRVENELDVIGRLSFASYFLINWDIVRFARREGFYYVGRGSGSNSIVAYLLRITDVDPIELDLYFERFINLHRSNAPDFDMDFSWTDRDDITAYIFKRFGTERTALLGAYNTFQHDAVTRELGKVFGLPPNDIDKLQRTTDINSLDEISRLVIRYSHLIKGFPSHLSIHASGIIISEKPISCYTATSLPPKGYATTQFSMLEAEDIGLYKFDILSQRGLGKIKDTIDIVKQNKGIDIDVHNVAAFKTDENIKALLRKGNTIGCFYVESPAMRMLLAKLRADDYLRLVAASSIIRPGVAKSGMMREYILRYRHPELREKARAALPELYDILEETYGVMVYQEDVIKVAHLFADLTLAEADYLRKGMSWKFKKRNEFEMVKQNFFANCLKKGHQLHTITDIWNQIESFANFAFSKGHSASYAVESYQALFLKAYYPLEYMVATLNNGGGFYRKELYLHEARMHGANIHLPCINYSEAMCTIEGNIIYLGLGMIAELTEHTLQAILQERLQNGNYKNMHDFIARVPLSLEQMRLLVKAGTFNFTGRNKTELLWEIHSIISPHVKKTNKQELFQVNLPKWELPTFNHSVTDEAFDEMALFGFSLSLPFGLLKHALPNNFTAKEMPKYINQTISIVGYWVNTKKTYTSNGDKMYFGTFTDLEGNWIDTVHFPPSAKQFPFTGPGCYLITGKVVNEYDFMSIEVSELKRLPMVDREA